MSFPCRQGNETSEGTKMSNRRLFTLVMLFNAWGELERLTRTIHRQNPERKPP